MSALLELLAERCLAIALAVTAVLVIAAMALACSRSPLHRERTAGLGIVGAALAFVLMLVPMPGPVGQLSSSLQISGTKPSPAPALSISTEASRIPPPTQGLNAIPALAAEQPILADQPDIAHQVAMMERRRTTAAQPQSSVTPPDAVATAVGSGALAMLAYLVLCTFLLARLARRAEPLPAWLMAALPACGGVRLLLCQRSQRPFCFGLLRSHVVLPADLVRRKNTALLRCVVQHELAHVQLGHLRWRKWIAACSVLLYAHPLYWWLARQQREAAELLADDQAAGLIGKALYVEQLIGLVEQLRFISRRSQLPLHLPMSALGAPQRADGPFYHRMKTLLMRTTTLRTNLTRLQFFGRGLAAVAVLSMVTIAVGRPAFAQEASTKIPAADDARINVRTLAQGAYEVPRVKSFSAVLSVERIGEVLCNVADKGVHIADLTIELPDENGNRRVSFRILEERPSAVSLPPVLMTLPSMEVWEGSLLNRLIVDETSANLVYDQIALLDGLLICFDESIDAISAIPIDVERAIAVLDVPLVPFDELARGPVPQAKSASDGDLERLLLELQLSNQALRNMVLELQRNVAALQERAGDDFLNF